MNYRRNDGQGTVVNGGGRVAAPDRRIPQLIDQTTLGAAVEI